MRRVLRIAALTLSLAAAMHAAERVVPGHETREGGRDAERPVGSLVRIEILGTPAGSATGTSRAKGESVLAVGERRTWYVIADSGQRGNLCTVGISPDEPTSGGVRWKVETEVVETAMAGASLSVHWTRSRAHGGAVEQESDNTRVVKLEVGERQVLDYVAGPPSSSCASALLQFGVDALPVPETAAPLAVDLWLEYTGRLGRRWERKQFTTRPGVQTPFSFTPMEWAVQEGVSDAAGGLVRLEVSGTLLGVAGDNGFVNIALRGQRRLSWSGAGSVGGGGQVEYRAADGEAATLVLPEPVGEVKAATLLPLDASIPGVTHRNGVTRLNLKQFLDGNLAIHVVVHQQEVK